jgi:hypothetical protein
LTNSKKDTEYWKKEINEIIEKVKTEVEALGFVYCAGKYERIRAKNIITSKTFLTTAEHFGLSPPWLVSEVLKASSQDKFWAGKLNNCETIYAYYAKVINSAKSQFEQKKSKIAILKPIYLSSWPPKNDWNEVV